ncbi:unnamed protein product [Triticum turgidum subsp. durum]|uniref:GATA-type domain-containing protein n=1 Tax=Triticum turgidum subsp. durum TaxID=4567 RepID=A0A9R1PUS2_TRITD|nr:unnamed protein product [Triticum turgidum subsp. durum]
MLHQTLIPSCLAFSASASPDPLPFASNATAAAPAAATHLRSSAMPSYAHHHSSLDERMDALKGSSRQEETPDEAAAEAPAAWGFAERDGFSVEDLLDLEEFCEPDKDGADEPQEAPAADVKEEKLNDGPQQPVVSYELAPPAPPAPEIVDLPAHDVEEELEWVSRIMDDSLSELPPQPAPPASMMASLAARPPQRRLPLPQRHPQDGAYRALPSMSDPMRTPTICALSTEALVPIKAKRSKRSRASGWSLSGPTPDSTSSSSTTTTSSCSSSASFSPYFLMDSTHFGASELMEEYNILPPPPKKSKHGKSSKQKAKKRGRKPKNLPAHPSSAMEAATQSDRRCSHCGVQKTPQWRAGPEGAKTLCNACGVRYKSGRLLPEYRPACSPTYVSSVHSNSHRKVLEMRRKKEDGPLTVTATAPAVASF